MSETMSRMNRSKSKSMNQWSYKKKLYTLSCLAGLLALVYGATFIFDSQRLSSRSAFFAWVDAKTLPQVDRIELGGPGGEVNLSRKNNVWAVTRDGNEFPAKEERVEDLLKLLSRREPYPVRASSPSAHEKLGLQEGAASRITLLGGPSPQGGTRPPLLDLLVGNTDFTGAEVYLRKNGQDQVRSGTVSIDSYLKSAPNSWLNLRLFAASAGETRLGTMIPGPDTVQRINVTLPAEEESAAPGTTWTLSRSPEGWIMEGGGEIESSRVESWLSSLISAEAEDYNSQLQVADADFNQGRISLELGDGSQRNIRIGPQDEQNRRNAVVSGSSLVYILSSWTLERLFRDAAYFSK
jgi:hypothetical protein